MKVIVNADDFGISHEVNRAICQCFEDRVINRTTIMINMPHAEEAIEMAKSYGFMDKVGLHLNFTEGRPLTKECLNTPLCDKDGNFSKLFITGLNRFWYSKYITNLLRLEAEAQINAFFDKGFPLKHLDSHQHTHLNLGVFRAIKPVIIKHGFSSIRFSRNIPPKDIPIIKKAYKFMINSSIKDTLKRVGHNKEIAQYMGPQEDFAKFLNDPMDDKITEIMIHPMYDSKGVLTDSYENLQILDWVHTNQIRLIEY